MMTEELEKRIHAALDSLEAIEHRVAVLIEGNRQQLDNVMGTLKIRELRHELHCIAVAIANNP